MNEYKTTYATNNIIPLILIFFREAEAQAHLPWFDFILVVILKDAFIAQTQPPWDPLFVLKNTAKLPRYLLADSKETKICAVHV